MTEGEIVAIGARAMLLLEDDVFVAACAVVNDGCIERWKFSTTIEDREAAHARLIALGSVVAELRGLASQGKRVASEVERRKATASRS